MFPVERALIRIRILELKQEFNKARHALSRHRPSARRPSSASSTSGRAPPAERSKARMSLALVSLLVYTVGVKCRGLNKKEQYAPEHVFSLSENTANKMFRQGAMADLIKHTRAHVVRVYPKGLRLSSSNYEPHRYWSAGAQLVAINWQTFGASASPFIYFFALLDVSAHVCCADLGYMINHAMFQRNGRSGYVLKPLALRSSADKDLLGKRTKHFLDVTVRPPSCFVFSVSLADTISPLLRRADHLRAAAASAEGCARPRGARQVRHRPVRRGLRTRAGLDADALHPARRERRGRHVRARDLSSPFLPFLPCSCSCSRSRRRLVLRGRDDGAGGVVQDGRGEEQRVQPRVGGGAEPAVRLRRRDARARVRKVRGARGGRGRARAACGALRELGKLAGRCVGGVSLFPLPLLPLLFFCFLFDCG